MREKKESWLLSQDKKAYFFFYLLVLFLPTQFGKHFWPQFSFIQGLRLDYLSPTIYFTDILILLVIFFSYKQITAFFLNKKKENIFFIVLFFLSLLIGISVSKNPMAGIYGLIKVIEYLLLGVFVVTAFKKINKKYFVFALICGILFESFLSFAQVINNGSINGIFYFLGERYFNGQTPGIANASISGQLFLRPYATFSHPNVLAGYLLISLLFVYMLRKYIPKKLLFFVTLIGTISLLLTLSRVAILFWIFFIVLRFGNLLLEKYKKRNLNKKNTISVILFLLILIVIFSFFQNNIFVQRFSQTKLSDESFIQREKLIRQSINMFIKNPVLGVGINNFYNNVEIQSQKNLFVQPVHNVFLLMLSQTGIIGFIFFLVLLFKSMRTTFLKKEKNQSFLLILAFIVLGLFDHYFLTIQQGQILFVLIFSERFSAKIN